MKTHAILAVSALALAAAFSGTTSASISTGSLSTDVQSAVGSGNTRVILRNGVATLFGVVENKVDANAAKKAASNFPGVEKVISHIYVSS